MKPIFWLVIIGGLFIATYPLSAALLDDAVGIWLFDEGKGGVAADTSGNKNDGAITGAKWAEGKFGGALEFELPHVVTVKASNSLNFKDQMTIATWVYMNKGVSDTAIRRNGFLFTGSPIGRRKGTGWLCLRYLVGGWIYWRRVGKNCH